MTGAPVLCSLATHATKLAAAVVRCDAVQLLDNAVGDARDEPPREDRLHRVQGREDQCRRDGVAERVASPRGVLRDGKAISYIGRTSNRTRTAGKRTYHQLLPQALLYREALESNYTAGESGQWSGLSLSAQTARRNVPSICIATSPVSEMANFASGRRVLTASSSLASGCSSL